jgi:hypothetical protein
MIYQEVDCVPLTLIFALFMATPSQASHPRGNTILTYSRIIIKVISISFTGTICVNTIRYTMSVMSKSISQRTIRWRDKFVNEITKDKECVCYGH